MFSSSIQSFGDNKDAPDYVYYNADIINNTTANTFAGAAVIDPQIRFNETRDAPLIRNAADYYFSIVRFEMNGVHWLGGDDQSLCPAHATLHCLYTRDAKSHICPGSTKHRGQSVCGLLRSHPSVFSGSDCKHHTGQSIRIL